MAHSIGLEIPNRLELQNSDVIIVVKKNADLLGTLTMSKGSIDWRPKNARRGKGNETSLSWTQFAAIMEENKANR